MKLASYREKRDRSRTNEPFGADPAEIIGGTSAGMFVVHLHAAKRAHYDLRLPVGGVLASFAIPKGPSLDPGEKRFAARTEDHPVEYIDFEAVIPEGNYGAGPMIVWDTGRVRYLDGPAEDEIERGKIDFELHGHKLKGRFALVRSKKSDNEWLFFKKPDAFASAATDIALEQPRSVLSGLTVDELRRMPEIARAIEEEAAELGAPRRRAFEQPLAVLTSAAAFTRYSPMACTTTGAPSAGSGWLYELKLDGVRALAIKEGRDVSIKGRSLRDITSTYPEVARAVSALAAPSAVLDGEIVTFDDAGQPSFQRLGHRIHQVSQHDIRMAMAEVPVVCVLFDLLAIGGYDLISLPLVTRKRLLRRLLPAPGVLRVLDHLEDDGRPLLAFCRERGLEGVVAKRAGSPYRPGVRSPDWVKMKCERDEDFVVVGMTRGEGARESLGALDIASWEGGRLIYRGKVGSGLSERDIDILRDKLMPLRTGSAAAEGEYPPAPRGRTHVRPEIVVSVRFLGWSEGGSVRHPTFRGIRDDIDPGRCTAGPKRLEPTSAGVRKGEREDRRKDGEERADEGRPPATTGAAAPRSPTGVVITNPAKILFPDEGISKGDLCAYYRDVAPVMLPYLRDRPIMMVRYPEGVKGKSFYQWNAPPGAPSWLRTCRIKSETGAQVEVFVVDDADGLLYLANLACIPIHILASRAGSLDECDFLTLDFDVKNSSLAAAVELARELRSLLSSIDLEGYPKTSGQSGLHVLVPLGPGVSHATARALADLLGHLLVRKRPEIATMERLIARRGARVYVDTGQTGPSRTIVAPYSVRAQKGATVSTPLHWAEVEPSLDPGALSIRSVIDRARSAGDPMEPMLRARPDVAAAAAKLEERTRNTSDST